MTLTSQSLMMSTPTSLMNALFNERWCVNLSTLHLLGSRVWRGINQSQYPALLPATEYKRIRWHHEPAQTARSWPTWQAIVVVRQCSCHICEPCKAGRFNSCINIDVLGPVETIVLKPNGGRSAHLTRDALRLAEMGAALVREVQHKEEIIGIELSAFNESLMLGEVLNTTQGREWWRDHSRATWESFWLVMLS